MIQHQFSFQLSKQKSKTFKMKRTINAIALTISMLMNHFAHGQLRYPIQQIIGKDTVITSTVQQINTALKWKSDLSFCKQELSILYDSIIPAYQFQIKLQDSIIKNQDSIIELEKQKFTIADSAYRKTLAELSTLEAKHQKTKFVRNFFIGFSAIVTTLIFIK